jgi:hypothetical protein
LSKSHVVRDTRFEVVAVEELSPADVILFLNKLSERVRVSAGLQGRLGKPSLNTVSQNRRQHLSRFHVAASLADGCNTFEAPIQFGAVVAFHDVVSIFLDCLTIRTHRR